MRREALITSFNSQILLYDFRWESMFSVMTRKSHIFSRVNYVLFFSVIIHWFQVHGPPVTRSSAWQPHPLSSLLPGTVFWPFKLKGKPYLWPLQGSPSSLSGQCPGEPGGWSDWSLPWTAFGAVCVVTHQGNGGCLGSNPSRHQRGSNSVEFWGGFDKLNKERLR